MVVSAGLSQPSATRLLADRLAAATEAGLAEPGIGATRTTIELREIARDLVDRLLTNVPSPRLEEAIEAHREALEEQTRERVPYYWAQTQENLAIVLHILAVRTTGATRLAYLADALTAVDGALEVYREGDAAYDIAGAERLRAAILAEQQQAQVPPR